MIFLDSIAKIWFEKCRRFKHVSPFFSKYLIQHKDSLVKSPLIEHVTSIWYPHALRLWTTNRTRTNSITKHVMSFERPLVLRIDYCDQGPFRATLMCNNYVVPYSLIVFHIPLYNQCIMLFAYTGYINVNKVCVTLRGWEIKNYIFDMHSLN